MPPLSLTLFQKASMPLPITPYAEAGPLYGPQWPSLISPSPAPASYFLSANAIDEPDSNATRDAPPRNPRLLVTTEILPADKNGGRYVWDPHKKKSRHLPPSPPP